MKKILPLLSLALLLVSCGKNSPSSSVEYPSYDSSSSDTTVKPNVDSQGRQIIDIYGLNDFHGAVAEDAEKGQPGFSRIAAYLKQVKTENPGGTMIVSTGDMWQGSADSNITKGELVTDLMNYVGFDAMALGNHEFDWTTEYIYHNAEKANFPFLGANIIKKADGTMSDLADASVMIERGELKIGVIGTIGEGLTRSIVASAVADYEFVAQADIVKNESERLKAAGANTVILLTHDSWTSPNADAMKILNGSYVDAVFNGHAHASDQNHIVNNIPIVQTSGNGQEIMHIQLAIATDGTVTPTKYQLIDGMTTVHKLPADEQAQAIYDYYYQAQIKTIKEEKVGTLSKTMYQDDIAYMAAHTMLQHAKTFDEDVVAAIHNRGGGIRVNSWAKGAMTYGEIYATLPFDNYLAIYEMSGSSLNSLRSNAIVTDGTQLVSNQYYRVVIISYLSEGYAKPHLSNGYEVMISEYVRDLVAQEFRTLKTINPEKYAANHL